jgi:hypothetical protein
VPAGRRNPLAPLPGEPAYIPGRDDLVREGHELAVDGPVRVSHTFLPSMNMDLDRIRRAIAAGDPIALFAINEEYAPSWCPTCGATYCADHWLVSVEHDQGFYDLTRGRCPEGHERILDD